ncbi:MAG: hypothetical protein PUC53_05550 [Bacteroidales bacterium]|nr:hypothetical protein [Bacteroidales bacterium]
MRFFSCCLILAAVSFSSASAQDQLPAKAETKLYNKTISKASLSAYNKFLNKYPSSVYSDKILTLRDSTEFSLIDKGNAAAVDAFLKAHKSSPLKGEIEALLEELCRCPLSQNVAQDIAAENIAAYDASTMLVLPVRELERDCVFVIDLMPKDLHFNQIRLYSIAPDAAFSDAEGSGNWNLVSERAIEKYCLDPSMDRTIADGALSVVNVAGARMLKFDYLNWNTRSNFKLEWCSTLIPLDGSSQTNLMFYGRNMLDKAPAAAAYSIEGQSPETLSLTGMSQELSYLFQGMNGNEALKPLSEADAMSDEAILWWLGKNPKAETSATSVKPGTLKEGSSLVGAFKNARGKESSSRYSVACMDFRGYTVIVSQSKSSKEYSLVWAEPICKNKSRDKYIRNIYFDNDGTTLNLMYYKAKTSFKIKINLNSKTLTRTR